MSKQEAAMALGILGSMVLFFLWVYGLIDRDAPKVIKIGAWSISGALCLSLLGFAVYCIYVLVA